MNLLRVVSLLREDNLRSLATQTCPQRGSLSEPKMSSPPSRPTSKCSSGGAPILWPKIEMFAPNQLEPSWPDKCQFRANFKGPSSWSEIIFHSVRRATLACGQSPGNDSDCSLFERAKQTPPATCALQPPPPVAFEARACNLRVVVASVRAHKCEHLIQLEAPLDRAQPRHLPAKAGKWLIRGQVGRTGARLPRPNSEEQPPARREPRSGPNGASNLMRNKLGGCQVSGREVVQFVLRFVYVSSGSG